MGTTSHLTSNHVDVTPIAAQSPAFWDAAFANRAQLTCDPNTKMAMGQKPVPPVNIPIPTKIGSKMGGAPTPKWDTIGFDPQPN